MGRKHRSSSRDGSNGWYDQLQAAILELITCRDVGDLDDGEVGERPPPCSWWECAEGDCGLELEERRRPRHVIEHRPADTSEIATLEWSRFDTHQAPSLLPPAPLPKPKGCEDHELPMTHLTQGPLEEKKIVEVSPLPRRDAGGAECSRLKRTTVQDTVVYQNDPKRMGPQMICPAVPQKLGDHPAPSFQVGRSFLEPFSGLSTASSLPRKTQGCMVLQVLLQNDRWVPLRFNRNDDLMRCACDFLEEHKLSSLVKKGLLNQLKQMVAMRQLSASVDIVDLL